MANRHRPSYQLRKRFKGLDSAVKYVASLGVDEFV